MMKPAGQAEAGSAPKELHHGTSYDLDWVQWCSRVFGPLPGGSFLPVVDISSPLWQRRFRYTALWFSACDR